VDAAKDFVGDKDRRKILFGRLTANDITDIHLPTVGNEIVAGS
jgi:hypothetical protein